MAVKKEKKKKAETSKEIVVVILIIFSVSMIASYVLPIFFQSIIEQALSIFQTTATLTGSILIGYYGKAGFENYDKNKKMLKFEERETADEDSEGGNG